MRSSIAAAGRALLGLVVLSSLVGAGTNVAAASGTSATIRVRIAATAGAPATTVAIDVTTPAEPARHWTAHVPTGRTAVFPDLPPGAYHVVIDDSGRTSVADLRLEAGELVDVNATIAGGAGTLAPLVVVDRVRMWQGTSFRGPALTDLPSTTSLWALLDTAEPFLIADRVDNGGLTTATSALIGSRGASWTTTTVTLGDITLPGPSHTGALALIPDLSTVDVVGVTTGVAPLDIGPPGAAITLAPRRPSQTRGGDVAASYTGPRLVSDSGSAVAPSIARLDRWSNFSGDFSAPIGARAGVFVAGANTDTAQTDRAESYDLPANVSSVLAHIVANPGAGNQIRVLAAAEHATRADDGRLQFAGGDVDETDTFAQFQAAWDHFSTNGLRRLVAVGYDHGRSTPDVTGTTPGGTMDLVFDGPIPDPPADAALARLTARVELQPRTVTTGAITHDFLAGLTVVRDTSTATTLDLPTVGELVDGLAARVWMGVAPTGPSARHATDATVSGSDAIHLATRLTFDVGVRADVVSAAADGAPTGISWRTLAPRAELRWAPRLVTLSAGYRRSHPDVSLDWLAFGDPGAPTFNVFRWNDANGNRVVDPGETGVLVARAGHGGSIGSIDPALTAPTSDEVTFGAERQVGSNLRLTAAATFRREENLLASVDTGAPASAYTTSQILDQGVDYFNADDDRLLTIYNRIPATFGQDRYLLTNAPGGTSRYEGLEVGADLRTDRLFMIVGAMAYLTRANGGSPGFGVLENDPGVIGTRLEDPNAAPFEPGATFFDRSYVLKWSVAYQARHDVHLGVSARYEDGEPFSRLVVAPDLTQGPDLVEAYRIGRTRFTFSLTLDARIEKGFTIGRARAAVSVAVFNLTNAAIEVEENPVTGATFRETTAVQPPRTVRLGLTIRF